MSLDAFVIQYRFFASADKCGTLEWYWCAESVVFRPEIARFHQGAGMVALAGSWKTSGSLLEVNGRYQCSLLESWFCAGDRGLQFVGQDWFGRSASRLRKK